MAAFSATISLACFLVATNSTRRPLLAICLMCSIDLQHGLVQVDDVMPFFSMKM